MLAGLCVAAAMLTSSHSYARNPDTGAHALAKQLTQAFSSRDYQAAERLAEQLAKLQGDGEAYAALGAAKLAVGKASEAAEALDQAIKFSALKGHTPHLDWLSSALAIHYRLGRLSRASELAFQRAKAFPTPDHIRQSLLLNVQLAGSAPDVHSLRLVRHVGSLSEVDYVVLLDHLVAHDLLGEAAAVLKSAPGSFQPRLAAAYAGAIEARTRDDRAALDALTRSVRSGGPGSLALRAADAHAGYDDLDTAIDLYRMALQREGADRAEVNLRLGEALVRASRPSEALAAFNAVTGRHAPIAALWLAWLQRA